MERKVCTYCGKEGHNASNCPWRPSRLVMAMAAALAVAGCGPQIVQPVAHMDVFVCEGHGGLRHTSAIGNIGARFGFYATCKDGSVVSVGVR